jgi:hypothetical protein
MTESTNFKVPFISPSQAQKHVTHNDAIEVIDSLIQRLAKDSSLSSPPASPAQGDIYIIASSPAATGLWSGQENSLARFDGSVWKFSVPQDGWQVYDQTSGNFMIFGGTSWSQMQVTSPYDLVMSFGAVPTSSQVIETIAIVRDLAFPADLAGSVGTIGTNPTASFVLSLQDDGVEFATVTVDTAGVFTFATSGNAVQSVAAGSILTAVAPATVDVSAANCVMTILGES